METITKAMGTALIECAREPGQAWNPTGRIKVGDGLWVKVCPDCLEKMRPVLVTSSN